MIYLMKLPYSEDALEPHISSHTLKYHYGAHHKGYVTTLNTLIEGTPYADLDLQEIVKKSAGQDQKVFNNAAQVWNHNFYWHSLCVQAGSHAPVEGSFYEAVKRDFGGYNELIKALVDGGLGQFGSGWVWLCKDVQGNLSIKKTSNADVVWLCGKVTPLLVCDVWEHAYYLDYQNRRVDYLNTTLSCLLNWSFAQTRYSDHHVFEF